MSLAHKKKPTPADRLKDIGVPIIVALLGTGFLSTFVGPTILSTFVIAPKFEIHTSSDLSNINVTNTGETAAHQVKITLLIRGNHTAFLGFSSENITWMKPSFDAARNQTMLSASLLRLGEQGKVSIRLDKKMDSMELWVSSNEIGTDRIEPAPPVSFSDTISQNLTLITSFLIIFVVWLGIGTYLRRRYVRLRSLSIGF